MDRRSFLKGLFVVGAGALCGLGSVKDAFAVQALYEAKSDEEWLERMMEIAAPDIPEACHIALTKFSKPFDAVERATGFPMVEQMAMAFIETRMGQLKSQNLFGIQPDTFAGMYVDFMDAHLDTVRAYDAAFAARAEEAYRQKKKGCIDEQGLFALAKGPFVSALFTGWRIDGGRKIVVDKVGEQRVEPYIDNGLKYLIHNMGENYLARFLLEPDKPAVKLMKPKYVVNRAMSSKVKAESVVVRLAGLFINVRDAIADHTLTGLPVRPDANQAARQRQAEKPAVRPA